MRLSFIPLIFIVIIFYDIKVMFTISIRRLENTTSTSDSTLLYNGIVS